VSASSIATELALGAGRAQKHDLGRLVEMLVDPELRPPSLPVVRSPERAALGATLDEGDVIDPHGPHASWIQQFEALERASGRLGPAGFLRAVALGLVGSGS
jgi:hypothetical protein